MDCVLLQASRPAQELMALKADDYGSEQRELFTFLPKQLAALFVQAHAYKDIAKGTVAPGGGIHRVPIVTGVD
jgi:hypothetical protein